MMNSPTPAADAPLADDLVHERMRIPPTTIWANISICTPRLIEGEPAKLELWHCWQEAAGEHHRAAGQDDHEDDQYLLEALIRNLIRGSSVSSPSRFAPPSNCRTMDAVTIGPIPT